ncbi:MAG: glyoxalase [Oligoflexia bacterium]|nr:glyoxalase [Oligoflexia bacterium]
MFKAIHTVMFHVEDTASACAWYSQLLEVTPVYLLPDFPVLRIGYVEICFHKADAKVASGKAGSVVYWHVSQFNPALERAKSFGGKLHRGPLEIEDGNTICQILDPFGNLFGIVGPEGK